MGTIPVDWEMSGQMISTLATQMNELTLLFVSVNDVRLVNRISNYNDTEAPSTPLNLVASDTTDTTTSLAWDASTDNIAVTSYKVRKGGVVVSTPITNSATITGLTAETAYSFTVSALDANGNESGQSIALNVTTIATPVVISNPSTLTNLHLWYDGTDSASMTLSGNTVTNITDKAGNINLASTATPEFNVNKIIFNEVEFDRLSSGTISTVLDPDIDFHGYFIFKSTSNTQRSFIINVVNGTSLECFGIGLRDNKLGVAVAKGGAWQSSKGVAFSDISNYHKLEFKNTSGIITAFLDGVEMITTGTVFASGSVGIQLGGSSQFSPDSKSMDFKEFFVKSGAMTTQEKQIWRLIFHLNTAYNETIYTRFICRF